MKKIAFLFLILCTVTVFAGSEVNHLKLGDKAVLTDVKMKDVSGSMVSIADAAKENGVVVMFSCNTCPFVIAWEDRYIEAKKWADKNKVGMIVLNSNYKKRAGDDSFDAMKKHALGKGYNFNYVVDKESVIANAFGGQTTPHVFLFDKNMKLVYKGAIDDNYKSSNGVEKAYLKDALISVGKGEKVALQETKPVGCSIKRKTD